MILKTLHITFTLVIFFFQTFLLKGQAPDSLLQNDTLLFSDLNTNAQAPDYYDGDETLHKDIFFDSLKIKAEKKTWTKQLHQWLVVEARKAPCHGNNNGYDRTVYFEKSKGKRIRNINIKKLDVFGPSVEDTTAHSSNWAERVGNSMHFSTLNSAIKNYLFFESGEKIDPYLLADNERILRTIPSIQDARIYVIPIDGDDGAVDVQIVTKDVWALGVELEAYDFVYGKAAVWNSNLLGLGHHLGYTSYYDLNREPGFGYQVQYKIPNIGNSLTSFDISHKDKWDVTTTKAYLTRDFLTPAMNFGGGIGYEKNFSISSLTTIDSVYKDVRSDYEYYEAWTGYSKPIHYYHEQRLRKTFFTTFRGAVYKHFVRPDVEENYLYQFHDRQYFLTSLGFAIQGYNNTSLIYGFGDTEDIPLGAMFKTTFGYEVSEFTHRYYFGATLSSSWHLKKLGYLSHSFEYGTFYKDRPEQGVIKYKISHISPLLGSKRKGVRHFFNFEYNQGFNRFDDEYVSIFKNEGIRGLNNIALKGNKKFYLNSELVYFSPHYLYGFRFVYFLFCDAGMVNFREKELLKNPVYSSLGIGVRIRNERLVFNTLQLRLNFFPFNTDIPGVSLDNFDIGGVPRRRMPDFANRKPELIEY